MKKFSSVLVVFLFSVLGVQAIDLVPSTEDIRLSTTTNSASFNVALNEDIEKLEGKTGVLKAKIKYNKKLFDLSSSTIEIPYTNGVFSESEDIVVLLKDSDAVTESVDSKFTIKVPKKFKKKYKVNNYSNQFHIDVGGVSVKGLVQVPKFGFEKSNSKKKRKARLIAPLEDDVQVTLYEVNDDGSKGDEIATQQAGPDGSFEFELPEGSKLGDGFMVETDEIDGAVMEALVSDSENLAIDPISTYVANEIQAEMAINSDAEFEATEIEEIVEQIEEFNPTFHDSIEETIDDLVINYNDFTENMIEITKDDDDLDLGEVENLALDNFSGDDYFMSLFNLELSGSVTNDKDVYAKLFASELELGRAFITKPNFAGVVDMTPLLFISGDASVSFLPEEESEIKEGEDDLGSNNFDDEFDFDNEEEQHDDEEFFDDEERRDHCSEFGSEIEVSNKGDSVEDVGFYTTVDANNVLSVVIPAQAEFNKDFGHEIVHKDDTLALSFYPVGEGMYIGGDFSQSNTYAVADNEQLLNGYIRGFVSFVKKSDLALNALEGTYGLVGYGTYFDDGGRIGLDGFRGTFVHDGLGAISYDFVRGGATIDPDHNTQACCVYNLNNDSENEVGEAGFYIKDSKIQLDIQEDEEEDEGGKSKEIFDGYARPDGKVIVFLNARSEKENGNTELDIAVKLPSSTPDLSGKSYYLLKQEADLNVSGGITLSTYKTATMSFSGTTVSFTDIVENVVSRDDCSAVITETEAAATLDSVTAAITTSGAISFEINGESFTGYIAEDQSMIVLQSSTSSSLAMYIAVLKQ